MRFEFATATEIVFGPGVRAEIPDRVRRLGTRVYVITGQDVARHASIVDPLGAYVVGTSAVAHEPTLDDARTAATAVRSADAEVVVAIGGGSVLDLGKATAALAKNAGDPLDYVEVIGAGRPLIERPLPVVAVPTTAGTGAEVTRNAVLASPGHRIKVSLRHPLMLPRLAIVDPELTRDLPTPLTASTGMDALTQLVEPYVSVRANPLTDTICVHGIERVRRSLVRATVDGRDTEARTDMALASLFGGLALANAGLGVVHGCAAVVGGRFAAPHGAVCAALLPGAVEVNLQALRSRDPQGPALRRYAVLARLIAGEEHDSPDALPRALRQLRDTMHIPSLSAYGIGAGDVAPLAAAAAHASSTRGNPIVLGEEELRAVLQSAL